MDNKTKILIGLGLAGIAYLIWKKKAPKSTASVDLPVEKIDDQIKKELPKETPATPATPASPSTPSTPPSVIPTPSSTPEQIIIPDIPPIVIDFSNLAPNIGSSLVNMNVLQQQKCLTVEEWLKMKENDTLPPLNSYCVESGGLIITDKQRLENAFQIKDFKNELSRDSFGNLNSFMQRGTDYSYLGSEYGGFGEGSGSGGLSEIERQRIAMGYGGNLSG